MERAESTLRGFFDAAFLPIYIRTESEHYEK